ncbi:MAG: glutamate--tRNA ligase family protein [Bacteroidia bacterium]
MHHAHPLHTRLAPTPSGLLHLGNAYSFLLTARLAHESQGSLLLRIDDLDNDRKRPAYLTDIFDSIAYLNIAIDRGPKSVLDFEANWSQTKRLVMYETALEKLVAEGHVFACSCSRKQLITEPCTCYAKKLNLQTPDLAWRMRVPENTIISFSDARLGAVSLDLCEALGNFVVRRRDGIPAYQLVSLIDDLHFGINAVVRGEDLLHSTAAQIFLAQVLGEKSFSENYFFHHDLIRNTNGEKLSKSEGAEALMNLMKQGKHIGLDHAGQKLEIK